MFAGAQDENVPLLERIKFLGIFSNNLDEFFKVRVATIKRMIDFQHGNRRFEGEKPKKLMNMNTEKGHPASEQVREYLPVNSY